MPPGDSVIARLDCIYIIPVESKYSKRCNIESNPSFIRRFTRYRCERKRRTVME